MRPILSLRRVVASCLILALSSATGCTSARVLSVQEEIQIGRQARSEVKRSLKPVRNRDIVLYVRKLGGLLVDAAGPSPFDISFDVIEDESLNAFATFGGAIFVNTGTILAAGSVDELAGVLAHEIGHVNGRHLAKQNPVNERVNFVTRLLGLAVAIVSGRRAARNTTAILSNIGASAYVTSFTRDAERESDAMAIDTMVKAGYDPNALATFFERIKAEGGGGGIPAFLRTHPVPDERIENAKTRITQVSMPAVKPEPVMPRELFKTVQARIRLLTGEVGDPESKSEEESDSDDE